MPTFASFEAFGSEVRKMARDFDNEQKSLVTRNMGEQAQVLAEKAASADLGGDAKFRGWAPELVTQLKPGRDGSTLLTPTRDSAGPWTVAEKGRNQGNAAGFAGPGINKRSGKTSRNKSGAVRKVRVTGARRWNGTTVGKHTASDAVKLMEAELPKVAEDGVRKIIVRHFDVS